MNQVKAKDTAIATENAGFSLLSLWRHKESRSVIIQILTVAGLMALVAWLVTNAVINLSALGKGYSFGFLSQPASYDIAQSLIEYNSQMSHFRAAVVGLLNTLLVAVMGIIAATIIGFIVGVMRLSKNYLVARVSLVFVEIFRNVPILLWILLVYGVITNNLPVPKNALTIGESFFLTNRGFYIPAPVWQSGGIFVFLAFVAGIIGSFLYYRRAKKIQIETGHISPVLAVSLGAIIGFPLVVFFIMGMPLEFSYAQLKGFNFQGGMVVKPEFLSLWGALSLYTAAFIAEIVRSGIMGVSHGQSEAAHSLGLRNGRTLQLVVIPQALRIIIPPLTSQYLNITKNSSLAIAVGYMDLTATLGGVTLNQTGREMECMTLLLLTYLTLSLTISSVMNWYNKRIKLVER